MSYFFFLGNIYKDFIQQYLLVQECNFSVGCVLWKVITKSVIVTVINMQFIQFE